MAEELIPLAQRWREIQGENYWKGLLEPTIDVELRRNVIKYGEFNQAIYDAWEADDRSKYVGFSKYSKQEIFKKVGLQTDDDPEKDKWGYEVSRYIYAAATSRILGRLFLSSSSKESWIKESNWIGMVSVATDAAVKRLGRRDIVVVWRGTLRLFEWIDDFHTQQSDASDYLPSFDSKSKAGENNNQKEKEWFNVLKKLTGNKDELFQFEKSRVKDALGGGGAANSGGSDDPAGSARGAAEAPSANSADSSGNSSKPGGNPIGGVFRLIGSFFNHLLRRKQNDAENNKDEDDEANPRVEKGWLLVYTSTDEKSEYNKYSARDQVLNELKYLLKKYENEDCSITVIGHSLGAALAVLNAYDIAEEKVNVKSNGDVVPVTAVAFGCPLVGDGAFKKRCEQLGEEGGLRILRVKNKRDLIALFPPSFMGYREVGVEMLVDHRTSGFLKDSRTVGDWHNLEAHLHLVAGYIGEDKEFNEMVVDRDPALVNKSCDFLKPELAIPGSWWQEQFKGLRQDPASGRWRLADRHLNHPEPMRDV